MRTEVRTTEDNSHFSSENEQESRSEAALPPSSLSTNSQTLKYWCFNSDKEMSEWFLVHLSGEIWPCIIDKGWMRDGRTRDQTRAEGNVSVYVWRVSGEMPITLNKSLKSSLVIFLCSVFFYWLLEFDIWTLKERFSLGMLSLFPEVKTPETITSPLICFLICSRVNVWQLESYNEGQQTGDGPSVIIMG